MKRQQYINCTRSKALLFGLSTLVLMVLTIVNTHAQVPPASNQSTDTLRGNVNTGISPKFVDENTDARPDDVRGRRGRGNGSGKQNKPQNRRRDQFIDKDGDGINDNRCRGMGIMRGRRHGKSRRQGQ